MDALMPMHLLVGRGGDILRAGPTLRKIAGDITGRALGEIADIRRPESGQVLDITTATPVRLNLRSGGGLALTGIAAPSGGGILFNLSPGIGIIDTVRRYGLNAGDFAPTDLTVELLYLFEAKEAVISETRRLNDRIEDARRVAEQQALTDTLTGLRNRRALDSVLIGLIEARHPFTMAHVDLDWFKAVNDTHGHAAGDHVLRHVSQMLLDETRARDTVARVGGDEFVLVLPGHHTQDAIQKIGRRILRRLEIPIVYDGAECRVSASLGVVRSVDHPDVRLDDLHAAADAALYRSKDTGRGQVSFAE